MELTGKQRRALRALAHHLKPVVLVGSAGLSQAVIDKIEVELDNHELIKVRVHQDAPLGTKEAGEDIAERIPNTHAVQKIGRMLVLYRARKKEPGIVLPKG